MMTATTTIGTMTIVRGGTTTTIVDTAGIIMIVVITDITKQ